MELARRILSSLNPFTSIDRTPAEQANASAPLVDLEERSYQFLELTTKIYIDTGYLETMPPAARLMIQDVIAKLLSESDQNDEYLGLLKEGLAHFSNANYMTEDTSSDSDSATPPLTPLTSIETVQEAPHPQSRPDRIMRRDYRQVDSVLANTETKPINSSASLALTDPPFEATISPLAHNVIAGIVHVCRTSERHRQFTLSSDASKLKYTFIHTLQRSNAFCGTLSNIQCSLHGYVPGAEVEIFSSCAPLPVPVLDCVGLMQYYYMTHYAYEEGGDVSLCRYKQFTRLRAVVGQLYLVVFSLKPEYGGPTVLEQSNLEKSALRSFLTLKQGHKLVSTVLPDMPTTESMRRSRCLASPQDPSSLAAPRGLKRRRSSLTAESATAIKRIKI